MGRVWSNEVWELLKKLRTNTKETHRLILITLEEYKEYYGKIFYRRWDTICNDTTKLGYMTKFSQVP